MLQKSQEKDNNVLGAENLEQSASSFVFPEDSLNEDDDLEVAQSPSVVKYVEGAIEPPDDQSAETGYERDPFMLELANDVESLNVLPQGVDPEKAGQPPMTEKDVEEDLDKIVDEKIYKKGSDVIKKAEQAISSDIVKKGSSTLKNMPTSIKRGLLSAVDANNDFHEFLGKAMSGFGGLGGIFSVMGNVASKIPNLRDKVEKPEDYTQANEILEAFVHYLPGITAGGAMGAFKAKNLASAMVKGGAFDSVLGFILDPVEHDNFFAMLSEKAPNNKYAQVLLGGLANNDDDTEWQRRLKNAGISVAMGAVLNPLFYGLGKLIQTRGSRETLQATLDKPTAPVALPPYRPNLDDIPYDTIVKQDDVFYGKGALPDLPTQRLPDEEMIPLYERPGGTFDEDLPFLKRNEYIDVEPKVPIAGLDQSFPLEPTIPLKPQEFDASKLPEGVVFNKDGVFYYKPRQPEIPLLPPADQGKTFKEVVIDREGIKLEKVAQKFEKESHNQKADLLRRYLATDGLESVYETPFFNKKTGEVYDPRQIEIKAVDLAENLMGDVPAPIRSMLYTDNVVQKSDEIRSEAWKALFGDKKKSRPELEELIAENDKEILDILYQQGYIGKTGKSSKEFSVYPVRPEDILGVADVVPKAIPDSGIKTPPPPAITKAKVSKYPNPKSLTDDEIKSRLIKDAPEAYGAKKISKKLQKYLTSLGTELSERALKREVGLDPGFDGNYDIIGSGFAPGVYQTALSEKQKHFLLANIINPMGSFKHKGWPMLPTPEYHDDEEGIRKYQFRWIVNPRYLNIFKPSYDGYIREAMVQGGGQISGRNLREIGEKIKAVFRQPIDVTLSNKPKIPQPSERLTKTLFKRKFNRIAKREKLFQGTDTNKLAERFTNLARKYDIDPVNFNYEKFIHVAKLSGLTDNADTALYNYMTQIKPVTGQRASLTYTPRPESLTRKQILERNIRARVPEAQDIGLQRHEILNNNIVQKIEFADSTLKQLQTQYRPTTKLQRLGIKWRINPNATETLPAHYEEQFLGMIDSIKEGVQLLEAGEDMAKKLISANGIELASLNPKNFALQEGVGSAVNNTAYMMDVIQGKKLPFQKAVTLFNHRNKINKAFKVELDPLKNETRLVPNTKFTFGSLLQTTSDAIFENLISQASTYHIVNASAVGSVMLRFVDDVFVDAVRTSKKMLGKLKGDEWLKFQSPESFIQKRFTMMMSALKPAMSDWANVISGIKDANLLLTNQAGDTFQMDVFRGIGVAERGANRIKEWRLAQGGIRNWATLPEYALRLVNATWGIGKLKATDAFVKRAQMPFELYQQVEFEVLNNIRTTFKDKPPTIAEAKRMIQERHAEALSNYNNRLPDPAVKLMLDELNTQLFRNKQAGILGGQDLNMGNLFRGMRKLAITHLGPVGRFISMFTEVAINAPDYFIQRIPGVQFANPHIRRQWTELGQKDEVIAKALTGLTLGSIGGYFGLKMQDRLKVTDSMEDKFSYREIYGQFPSADVSYQSAVLEDGAGRTFKIDKTLPIGQHINFMLVQMHYLNDYNKTGDLMGLINDSMINAVKNLTPWSLIEQYSGFIKAMDEWSQDKGSTPVDRLGSWTQRLMEIGLLKETKDWSRGFKISNDIRKGTLSQDMSQIREFTPPINIERVTATQLPLIDFDRATPPVAWDGYTIQKSTDSGRLNNIRNYFHYISRNQKANFSPINELLWEIESEDGNTPLKLSPTKNFSLKEIYLGKIKGMDKESYRVKTLIAEGLHKDYIDVNWKMNNYHHNNITSLSAGKMVSAEIIQNKEKKTIKLDFKSELKKLQDVTFNSDWLSMANFSNFKKHMKHIQIYGNDKVKAVQKVIGENMYGMLKKQIERKITQTPPKNYFELNNIITQTMKNSFPNISEYSPVLNTPEAVFNYNRLKVHFDNGMFKDFRERRKKSYEKMRGAINKVVNPYNELAKVIYLSKVVSKDEMFREKVLKPLETKQKEELLSGPYNLPLENKLDQIGDL